MLLKRLKMLKMLKMMMNWLVCADESVTGPEDFRRKSCYLKKYANFARTRLNIGSPLVEMFLR